MLSERLMGKDGTMLLSLSALPNAAIQFISETYQVRSRPFSVMLIGETNLPHGPRSILSVVIEATSVQANRKTSCYGLRYGHA